LQRSSAAGKAAAQPNKKLPQASEHSDPNLIDSATETKNSNFQVFQQTARAHCLRVRPKTSGVTRVNFPG
jgi:hypothetical protein